MAKTSALTTPAGKESLSYLDLPEKKLTAKFVSATYEREADPDSPGDTILGETGTIVRLPSLEGVIWQAPMAWITPNPDQPRSYFDPVKMAELKSTIASVGQKEPIKVVPYTDGESVRFFIVDGERRFRTLGELGHSHAKIIVGGETTLEEIFDISLILNISRAQHNPVEIARAFQRRINYYEENYPENETRRPTELVAEKYGFSEASIYAHLRILKLPDEILELIVKGKMPMSSALNLLKGKVKKSGDTEETRKHRLLQTAHKLLEQIKTEEKDPEESPAQPANGRRRGGHGPSKDGKITTGMIQAAKERALEAEGHGADAIRLATAENILKVVGSVSVLEPHLRKLLESDEPLVIAGLRSMGARRPPEVINDKILEVRILLERLQDLANAATLPPTLFIPKNKPGFITHLSKHNRVFGNAARRKMAAALAKASENGGQVLTWSEIAQACNLPATEITGNIVHLREELLGMGLDLQQFDVRRKDNRDVYEKLPAYRFSWTDARAKNPLIAETFSFKEIETKSSIISPDKTDLVFHEKKPYPDLTQKVYEYFSERVNALGREVQFHPVRGNLIIFELFPRTRQSDVVELGSNIKNFGLNYSIFEKDLLAIVQKSLPGVRAVLLRDIIRKQDQIREQQD